MSEINVNIDNFEDIVINSPIPVLVDFWAPWCGPCMMLAQHIEEIENEFQDKLTVAKINVDNNNDLAMKYQISSIPTLILFKAGRIIGTSVGYKSKSELIEYFGLNKL